jgi:16S rRNA (guanine527-N7)-methyltransferase
MSEITAKVDMTEGLKQCGIPVNAAPLLAEKMEAYIKEIILYNSAYNLTNTSDRDELVVRHIFDSLAAWSTISKKVISIHSLRDHSTTGCNETTEGIETTIEIADIGSGGGLPGIPLAAAFAACGLDKNLNINLVERMEKRCAFLENCAAILGLKSVTVINSEAERVDPEAYDLITFRAFRPLDKKMTKTLLRIVKAGGKLCAYKAKAANIKEEMDGITALVPEYEVFPLAVPGLEDSERNLVVITKA